MSRRPRALIVGLVAAFLLGATSSRADATSSGYWPVTFYTPNRAAICQDSYLDAFIFCHTPNDGWTVSMSYYGRVQSREWSPEIRGMWRNPYYGTPGMSLWNLRTGFLLGYGYSWQSRSAPDGQGGGPVWCVSRRSGLTCRNYHGHGWWIGRYRGYKIF